MGTSGLVTEKRNRHQERTDTTLRELLDAAETIFVRDGFERAQVEAIAAETGRSRGAVYAHFESKEDLFLALLERRIRMHMQEWHDLLLAARNERERRRMARERYPRQALSPEWALLLLEFKLFALRNPESRTRFRRLMEMLSEEQNNLFDKCWPGDVRRKPEFDAVRAVLRSIPSALVLESRFDPALDNETAATLLTKIFDAILPRN
jgi:AcrR family transcriptional regulator